jgi:guanylate kinase
MSPSQKPLIFIISAPSGSGKSTLTNELLKLVSNLEFSISYTTRAPRGSEQNGKQYHFIAMDEFNRMIEAGEFLEYAKVHENCYGTAREFLRQAGRKGNDLLLDIDVQGAAQVKHNLTDAISIFVLPPDRQTLEWRLSNRSENSPKDIQRRLLAAKREIEQYEKYDYVLINDKLQEACENLRAIVLSERLRRLERPLSDAEKKTIERAECCRLANAREKVKPILLSFGAPAPSARS